MAVTEAQERKLADKFQELFENELSSSEKFKQMDVELYHDVLQKALHSEGFPALAGSANVSHELTMTSKIGYDIWAEMYIDANNLDDTPEKTEGATLMMLYNFVETNMTGVDLNVHIKEPLHVWINKYPTLEYFVDLLEKDYSNKSLTLILDTEKPDAVRQRVAEKAKEEGFSNPESVDFKISDAELTIPLENYAKLHLDDIIETDNTAPRFIENDMYDDIIDRGLFRCRIELKGDPEDEA